MATVTETRSYCDFCKTETNDFIGPIALPLLPGNPEPIVVRVDVSAHWTTPVEDMCRDCAAHYLNQAYKKITNAGVE